MKTKRKRKTNSRVRLFMAAMMFVSGVMLFSQEEPARPVMIMQFEGVMDPFVSAYITRGVELAEEEDAECLIIQMDTPGGLDKSMRQVVKKIMNTDIPVVVYVSPKGARAASAGMFVTISADIAAMSPGTEIGAAHPVDMSGGPIPEKITNDAAAYARSIAEEHGRNADWAEKAVRHSISSAANDALTSNVVNLVVEDLDELIEKIDGWKLEKNKEEIVLSTKDAPRTFVGMDVREGFFHAIAEPNIAYILMSIGTLGIAYEIIHAGAVLPGVIGSIALILALMSLASLPVNLAGLFLIILALIMFVAEALTPTFGILGGGGVIAFVLGSFLLFNTTPLYNLATGLVVGFAVCMGGFVLFVVPVALRTRKLKAVSGVDILIGRIGVARSPIAPDGIALVESEEWKVFTDGERIEEGEKVEVIAIDGLKLKVRKADQG